MCACLCKHSRQAEKRAIVLCCRGKRMFIGFLRRCEPTRCDDDGVFLQCPFPSANDPPVDNNRRAQHTPASVRLLYMQRVHYSTTISVANQVLIKTRQQMRGSRFGFCGGQGRSKPIGLAAENLLRQTKCRVPRKGQVRMIVLLKRACSTSTSVLFCTRSPTAHNAPR